MATCVIMEGSHATTTKATGAEGLQNKTAHQDRAEELGWDFNAIDRSPEELCGIILDLLEQNQVCEVLQISREEIEGFIGRVIPRYNTTTFHNICHATTVCARSCLPPARPRRERHR